MTIYLFIFGMMREMANVLGHLRQSGIKGVLTDQEPWLRLEEIRKRWENQPAIRMRDRLAFHVGCETSGVVEGLKRLQERSDRTILVQYEQNRLSHTRHPIGDEVIFGASGVEQEDLEKIGSVMPEDSAQMTRDLDAIVRDLLRQCGARIPSG